VGEEQSKRQAKELAARQAKQLARHIENVESRLSNCSFDDLAHLLKAAGFTVRKSGGSSHVVFVRGAARLSVPFARPLKKCYVNEALVAAKSIMESLKESSI
jgi:hypothetical protein